MEKDKRLEIRISPDELAIIQERAAQTFRSVSDFVRTMALDKPIAIESYKQLDPADLAQIKRVGILLNQIAVKMNSNRLDGGTALLLHTVLDELKQLFRRELGVDRSIERR